MRITRRRFVKGALALGAGIALSQTMPRVDMPFSPRLRHTGSVSHAAGSPAPEHAAFLYDMTMCAGCHLCEVACQVNKGLPADVTLLRFERATPTATPENAWAGRRQQCMHCLFPACASACPVAAMEKTAAGPVVYHAERCLGCRYCMSACPFNVPGFDWDTGILDGALIRKCDMCADRQAEGRQPACVEACPTRAVIFGERSRLLEVARERIAQNPDRYVGHVYGESEAGGTSFLILSSVPFDELGLPTLGAVPLPNLPESVMSGVLPFALAWTAVLGGVAGLARLRRRNARKEEDE